MGENIGRTYAQTAAAVADEVRACLASVAEDQVAQALEIIDTAPRLFLAGAGRSALAVRGFAMRLMHLGMTVHVLGETTTPGIAAGDVLVIGSGSGRTASLLASAEKARSLGARIVLVTIDPGSPIAKLADAVVRIAAPSPKASDAAGAVATVQPMGSLFEQTLFLLLDALVVMLMQRRQITTDAMFTRHANLE